MDRYETTIEQEIKDSGIDSIPILGRGVINAERLSNELENPTDEHDSAQTTLSFIRKLDEVVESSENEFIDALSAESPRTTDILEGLKKCSVRSAVKLLLDMGTDSQRQYLIGRLERYAELISSGMTNIELARDKEDDESIRKGLWRDVVFASMIGTPELGALTIARNRMRHKATRGGDEDTGVARDGTYNLPKIRGYYSYIFPSFMGQERLDYQFGEYIKIPAESIDGNVGYVFPELAKTYEQILKRIKRKNPELDESELEHESVQQLARLIEKSTEYNPVERNEGSSYRSHFEEQLAWAQLGEQVQRQLRGMRQKIEGIDLHNIGRFIGKSGDNPYEKKWRKINSVDTSSVDQIRGYFKDKAIHEAKISFARNTHNPTTHIAELAGRLAAIGRASTDELLTDFDNERALIEKKMNSHMSLAQKALTLRFMHISENGGLGRSIDWINDAPFGLINRTHTMISRGVSKKTAFAYAIAEYYFPDETLTHEIIDACRSVTKEELYKVWDLSQKLTETNQDISVKDRLMLSRVSNRHDARDVFDLLTQGYSATQIEQYPWLCHLDTSETIDFPASGSEGQRQKWLAEHSYAYLNGGWNKNSVGKIIATRLESGIESSVHDASQWLEAFQIPEEGYDIQVLKALLRDGTISDISQVEKARFHDIDLEKMLIAGILHAPQELRDRLLLPSKAQKIKSVFFAPENQLIYTALVSLYKNPDLNVDMLQETALLRVDEFFEQWLVNAHGKDTTHRISKDDLRDRVIATLSNIDNLDLPADENITGVISRLGKYGDSRKRYIDDATSWLTRHMTTPSARLTKVWGDRATALINGVNDSAREIGIWQTENTIRLIGTDKMPAGLSIDEVLHKYRPWFTELSRVYSVEKVLKGIAEFKRIHSPNALLPPATIDLPTDDGVYKAEILAKDDPRGATIGMDTGCCMTLDGASASCIRSGYQDFNAGFFALYTPKGRLAAQSYFYVNPGHPDVLVLDNIEANQGRDTNKIVNLYKEAFVQYLSERFVSDSDWKIRTVHVGTGYGDAVKPTVLQLPQAPTIRNTLVIYTDAHDQRKLLELSYEQIEEFKQKVFQVERIEKARPQHFPEIIVHTVLPEQAEIIRELEKQIYPKHMRHYQDREMIADELHMRGMDQFSFLVAAEADSSKDFLGYCIAYLEQSETVPMRTEPVLYVADLAILPESQGGRIGSKMLKELLERANAHDVDKVEFHARETTSYAALMKSSWMQRLLYDQGFRLIDHGAVDEFDDGQGNIERLYLVSLEKV